MLDRLTSQRRAASGCRSVESVWMLSVPFSRVGGGVVRNHVQEALLEDTEGAVVGPAQSLTGFGHLVEHGLDPGAAGDCAEDTADRLLLFAHIFELASELGVVGGNPGHPPSLGRGGARRTGHGDEHAQARQRSTDRRQWGSSRPRSSRSRG